MSRSREREVAAARDRRRAARVRAAAYVVLGLALLSTVIALVLSIVALDRATTAAEQVVQDARTQRVAVGRAELDQANQRLIRRDLPVVAPPAPTATGDELLIQAARANVLADLPEPIVAQLREEVSGLPVLPSALTEVPPAALEDGDTTVDVLPDTSAAEPGDQPSSTPPGLAPGRAAEPSPDAAPDAPSRPAPRPPPASQPAIPAEPPGAGRGLLPDLPLVPRLPLLGG